MFPFNNPDLPLNERVQDLISRLTLEEKVSQTLHTAPAIPHLGIPSYNWWNECLHGVARAGTATVFPQAIGLAASWNEALMWEVAHATSTEARAKHHAALRRGNHAQYFGLTFWSPNINIFRDPRWGRGHETYGEDPFLTGRLGVSFVRGLQGSDETYLKTAACAKHYAVHSGPETDRHTFDAQVSRKDLYETYLPAFQALVEEAQVESIMGAYNRTNGEVCCGSQLLLDDILRGEWKFQGHVVSDCGAVCDFHLHHKVTRNAVESAALALNRGCDLNCGETFASLGEAVRHGLLEEAVLDRALTRLFTTRFKLGMFDPPERVPYAAFPEQVVNSPQHRRLALHAAHESIVLLKNDGLLPLDREKINSILVVGPNAATTDVLLANYNGLNPQLTTILEGLCGKVHPGCGVNLIDGCGLTGSSKDGFNAVGWYAHEADVIVAVMGLSPRVEGEEGDAAASDGGGDRLKITLPGVQEELLQHLTTFGKPVILVLMNGSAVAINWAQQHLPAIVEAWYPGQEGGTAVADVLFGDYNPGGRLPVTFYKSLEDVPDFRDYNMTGRTYRYFEGEPLYPFGHGLSYTKFAYSDAAVTPAQPGVNDDVRLQVTVTNTGKRAGDEVVQVYLTNLTAPAPQPVRALKAFQRIRLSRGQKNVVELELPAAAWARIDDNGKAVLEPGEWRVTVGGGQPIAPAGGTPPPFIELQVTRRESK